MFKSDQAQKCIDGLKTEACTDVSNNVEPAACSLVCGPASTGGTGGTGTLSAQDACKQVMAAMCERTSTCTGATGLNDLGGYTSVAACTTDMQSQDCATPAQAGCTTGQTYHADQAQLCVNGMVALSCTNFTAGTTPAACGLVCQ